MINSKHNLTVLHDDNNTFVDYSKEAASYLRDPMSLVLVNLEDYIYVGFEKPINSLYLELSAVGSETLFVGEYYNGSGYTPLSGFYDDSKGGFRDGFLTWSRNQDGEAKATVDSREMYWYRFKPNADTSFTLTGLNTVFNDLQDLKTEYSDIDADASYTPSAADFVNAKNNILQRINEGSSKTDQDTGFRASVDQWDILDIEEIKLAAVHFCMAKYFFQLSDSPDDIYIDKYQYYNTTYEKYVNKARLSLDTNDDGLKDGGESLAVSTSRKFSR